MAESSLSLGYPELRSAIGQFLGYGRTSGNWDAAQIADIAECLESGLRQFYEPPPLPDGTVHQWIFMKPVTTLSTVAGTADYTLPDSYGGIDGDLTYAVNTQVFPIKIVGEDQIRRAAMGGTSSGPPYMGSVKPISADAISTGQRYTLTLYPTPDAVYVLTYKRNFLPNNISATYPYPWGGEQHAETIKASCIAAAELYIDDVPGPRTAYFMQRLAASIESDRRLGRENFGMNEDQGRRHSHQCQIPYQNVLYNGNNIN